MSKLKKYNKFGLFGIEEQRKAERLVFHDTSYTNGIMKLLEVARKQLEELLLMENELSDRFKRQIRCLKQAFKKQQGKLTEAQLRWLNYLYDDSLKFLKNKRNQLDSRKIQTKNDSSSIDLKNLDICLLRFRRLSE